MDLKAFYKLTYGLYILSSEFEGKAAGCVVNTLTQVTAEPVKVAVAVSKDNFTTQIIAKSGRFAATSLLQEASMDLIGRFGFRSSADEDKFAATPHARDRAGIPYVTESAAAFVSCKVIDQLDLGTHILFIGEAEEAETLSQDEVLTYTYYQTVKKGGTPKNAPSYKGEAAAQPAVKGWRCTVCGYILESETLPPDFICPICHQGADKFVKL